VAQIKPPPTQKLEDLRAPRRYSQNLALSWRWRRLLALLVTDVWGLALAWKLAATLNQLYSPLPPQLDWGNWGGSGE
jgi:hypothetical protein